MLYNHFTTENIIIVDADYVSSVAFNLIVNFERMLERRIPAADMARWVECVALDGGLRENTEGEQDVLVILIHDSRKSRMENFSPSNYKGELDGKAFKSRFAEFCFTCVHDEADVVTKDNLLTETVGTVCRQEGVRRLMVVPSDRQTAEVGKLLDRLDNVERHTTLFTMEPQTGGVFRQQILGYSLMAAMGISGREIDDKMNQNK